MKDIARIPCPSWNKLPLHTVPLS